VEVRVLSRAFQAPQAPCGALSFPLPSFYPLAFIPMAKKKQPKSREPVIENRKAHHAYAITDTIECGIKLTGTEIKSVRAGEVSIGEGYVRAEEHPLSLRLHSIHIGEYPPAGSHRQHDPIRTRVLLAHKREIRKLALASRAKGMSIVPLKLYFVNGRAKILIGVGSGKTQRDKRQDLKAKDAQREIERALKR
jgi:SsrA-binding protein